MSLATEFREFAEWASDRSTLYAQLSHAAADADDVLALLEDAPTTQPPANLLLAAVHDLLLSGVEHDLGSYYATVTDDPLDPTVSDPTDPFLRFCRVYADEIRDRVTSRLVQTNDVSRSVVLYPAFARAASQDDGPLGLVEIGASAGLNLNWDRYGYVYGGRRVGDSDAPVRIETELRGEQTPSVPSNPPTVASRTGIDLNPLDVTDQADARWLRALVLPNQRRRHERLAASLSVAADSPPPLVKGDAVDRLPECLDQIPDHATPVVFSTVTLYQFPDEAIDALRSTLRESSHDRPVHWFSGDPATPVTDTAYRHVRFDAGEATSETIADVESHGHWLRWRAP